MKKVLYVCSVPGLSSYSIGFLRAVFGSKQIDAYAYICINAKKNATSINEWMHKYGISNENSGKVQFDFYGQNKYIRALRYVFFCWKYVRNIKRFAQKENIKDIHFLTQDVMLSGYLQSLKSYTLYYTVHDLKHHSTKKPLLAKLIRYLRLIRKDKYLVKHIHHLVTSSEHQFYELKNRFPDKKIYRHAMPNLITNGIMEGKTPVSELAGISEYVLFFGKIEDYKGVELLYDCFQKKEELSGIMLVAAGAGRIYFKRNTTKEKNIVFVNRFIADEEVQGLFQNASVLVLPYKSATQSAVSSLAYYFHKPVIISDVEGLTDSVVENKTGLIFRNNNADDLCTKILQLLNDRQLYETMKCYIAEYKDDFYNDAKLAEEIEQIYNL
jgi:glycosyltransferase involved in cell wall biosynthesis